MSENPAIHSRPIVAFREAVAIVDRDHRRGREKAGAACARLVGVTRQAASLVLTKPGALCPAGWAVPLALATGVARSSLRPDLYPIEDDPDLRDRPARAVSPAGLERAGQLCIPGTERKRSNVEIR